MIMKDGKKQKVGFTCSTFDLLHAGHILMLKESKSISDYLVVGLQVDPTIDRPTKNKPVQSITERYIQLNAVKYVDEIIVYSTEEDLLEILKSFPIDVRIIGEEYKGTQFTGHDLGLHDIYYNSRKHNFSSSALRRRVSEESK